MNNRYYYDVYPMEQLPAQDVISVRNAIVQEVIFDNQTGYVTIAYGVVDEAMLVRINQVVLIVTDDTVIQDRFGQNISYEDLKNGRIINAEFSSRMTRSIPPQAQAFSITLINDIQDYQVTEGRVIQTDLQNNFLLTGSANNVNSQMRFVITSATVIDDKAGNPMLLANIKPGDTVRVEHASFQTASIPPQTTAFHVHVMNN